MYVEQQYLEGIVGLSGQIFHQQMHYLLNIKVGKV